jgi:hypothetical protein
MFNTVEPETATCTDVLVPPSILIMYTIVFVIYMVNITVFVSMISFCEKKTNANSFVDIELGK